MSGMQYLVSFALLVALAAWMVGVYNNLVHLHGVVCNCWGVWCKAVHLRNQSLDEFASVFVYFVSKDDPLPGKLHRFAADSERSLAHVADSGRRLSLGFAGRAEQLLRQAVSKSVHVVEDSPVMRSHEHLQRVCSKLSAALFQQDQMAENFNRAAAEYNAALGGVSARLLAPLFGFAKVLPLEVRE